MLNQSHYYAFGMLMLGRNFTGATGYRYGFNRQERDPEITGASGSHYSAEFWEYDSRSGRRWNRDPKSNPGISSYSAFYNNPIWFSDFHGDTSEFYDIQTGDLLGTIYDNEALKRIKIDQSTFESERNKVDDMFKLGFMNNSTQQEKINYTANSIISGGVQEEELSASSNSFKNVIAFETGVFHLSYTGEMAAGNNLLANGTLKVFSHFDDDSDLEIESVTACGGGFGNGAPPNGNYTVTNPLTRTVSGMVRETVGFSFNLNPQFSTQRTDLRIHPDGNNAGTLGCIGIQESAAVLRRFYRTVRNATLGNNGSLNMNIDVVGNPNNHGGTAPTNGAGE